MTELVNKVLPEGETALTPDAVADMIDRGASEGGSTGKHWILDPIDGTKGFINGRQYAIALALMEEGEVTGGVLGCPNMPWDPIERGATEIPTASSPGGGVMFAAYEGCGALVAPIDSPQPLKAGVPINTHKAVSGSEACYMESWGDSIVAAHGETARLAEVLGVTAPPVRIDSMVRMDKIIRFASDHKLAYLCAS